MKGRPPFIDRLHPGTGRELVTRARYAVNRFTERVFVETEPRGPVVEQSLGDADHSSSDTEESTNLEPVSDEDWETTGEREGVDGSRPSGNPDSVVTDGGTSPVREPAVAGEFYAGSADDLRTQIRSCFTHDVGPGSLPDGAAGADPGLPGVDGSPLTLVVPHAGYPFSGPIAAHGYGSVARAPQPDVAVVLGPNHRRQGEPVAVAPHDRWETPLGDVPVDRRLAEAIVETSEDATFDVTAHASEHSIEVQLPFLQWVDDELPVLPVCLGGLGHDRTERLGERLARIIDRDGRDVLVVSSTDLTHDRPHHAAAEADEPVRGAIEQLDTESIGRLVENDEHSMCGPWATIAGLVSARELGAEEADVLQYATSADIAGDSTRVVGYCTAIVE